MALRGVYEGIYERPAGNYSARYQSQYQDYESFYIHTNPLSLFSPSPSFSSSSFFLFLLLPLSKRFKEVAWVFVELPRNDHFFPSLSLSLPFPSSSPLPSLPLRPATSEETTVSSKTIFTLVLPSLEDLFFRGVFHPFFFFLFLLPLFFFFFAPGRNKEIAVRFLLSLSLARKGLEIGLRRPRIKCLKGITGRATDTEKGRETILLRLTGRLSFRREKLCRWNRDFSNFAFGFLEKRIPVSLIK